VGVKTSCLIQYPGAALTDYHKYCWFNTQRSTHSMSYVSGLRHSVSAAMGVEPDKTCNSL